MRYFFFLVLLQAVLPLLAEATDLGFIERLSRIGIDRGVAGQILVESKATKIPAMELVALLVSEHGGGHSDFSGGRQVHLKARAKNKKSGARGIWQIMPYWARKFGFRAEDLYDPITSTKIAAQIVVANRRSHERCKGQKHDWVAHWKCAKKARDAKHGPCRHAQTRYAKILRTLLQ